MDYAVRTWASKRVQLAKIKIILDSKSRKSNSNATMGINLRKILCWLESASKLTSNLTPNDPNLTLWSIVQNLILFFSCGKQCKSANLFNLTRRRLHSDTFAPRGWALIRWLIRDQIGSRPIENQIDPEPARSCEKQNGCFISSHSSTHCLWRHLLMRSSVSMTRSDVII